MADIHGTFDERFAPVADVLSANLDAGKDVGASVCVVHDGQTVVDIWGGTIDDDGTAVGRGHDHQRLVDHQDDDVPQRAAARRPRRARLPRAGGPLLAGVRRQRQGGHRGAPPHGPHRRPRRLGRSRSRRPTSTTGRRPPRCWPRRRRCGSRAPPPATTPSPRATSSVRSSGGSPAARPSASSSPRRSPRPLGADFHIGTGPEHDHRVAKVIPPAAEPRPPTSATWTPTARS